MDARAWLTHWASLSTDSHRQQLFVALLTEHEACQATRADAELHAERLYALYPHTCQDGHQLIAHADSEHEQCPLCREMTARAAAEQRAVTCAAQITHWSRSNHEVLSALKERVRQAEQLAEQAAALLREYFKRGDQYDYTTQTNIDDKFRDYLAECEAQSAHGRRDDGT